MHAARLQISLLVGLFALAPEAGAQFQARIPPQAVVTVDWVQRFDHGIAGHDNGAAVTTDSQGNVLACGSSLGHYGSSWIYDTTTLKYAPDGSLLWNQRYHGPGRGFNSGAAWTVPRFAGALPLDRIVVAGSGYFTGAGHEFALSVFDVDGVVVGPPHAAEPGGFCLRGNQVFLHGGGSNGHDQDMLTAAFRVQ